MLQYHTCCVYAYLLAAVMVSVLWEDSPLVLAACTVTEAAHRYQCMKILLQTEYMRCMLVYHI